MASLLIEPNSTSVIFYSFQVKYTGRKAYNTSFLDSGVQDTRRGTKYTVKNLVPGTSYSLEVYGISNCGESLTISYNANTKPSGKKEQPVSIN